MLRSILVIILILINFFSFVAEDIYLAYRPLKRGMSAPFTLRADRSDLGHADLEAQNESAATAAAPADAVLRRQGAVLIPFLKTLDDGDMQLIGRIEERRSETLLREVPLVLFSSLFMMVFLGFFLFALPQGGYKRSLSHNMLLVLLIVHGMILKGTLLFTPLPVESLPFAALPLLVIALGQGRVTAVGATLTAAVLAVLFIGRTYGVMMSLCVAGMTAIMVAPKTTRSLHFIWPSIMIGLVNAVCALVLSPEWPSAAAAIQAVGRWDPGALPQLLELPPVLRALWALAGGISAGILTLILLPLMTLGYHIISTFRLRRYSDLDHPLLKQLFADAPGTYQHSMNVAYLSQAAGAAIGANGLLLRIGAYYHDIGKMTDALNFVENQINGENPHDRFDPLKSVEIIHGHVRNGVHIGLNARLPAVLIDLIRQHHGTQMLDYFYQKALKLTPQAAVRDADFRYPGPKPQTAEAALLMLADAVEAASRSLKEISRPELDRMVRFLTLKRIEEGQFSECDLDTRDIEKIICALVDALEVAFHTRIRYPWQRTPAKPAGKT